MICSQSVTKEAHVSTSCPHTPNGWQPLTEMQLRTTKTWQYSVLIGIHHNPSCIYFRRFVFYFHWLSVPLWIFRKVSSLQKLSCCVHYLIKKCRRLLNFGLYYILKYFVQQDIYIFDLESADLPVNEFARKKCKILHFYEINRNYRAQKLEVVKLEKKSEV